LFEPLTARWRRRSRWRRRARRRVPWRTA
jgi:hypothetical protein